MRTNRKKEVAEQKRLAGEEGRMQRMINLEEIRMNKISSLQELVGKRE